MYVYAHVYLYIHVYVYIHTYEYILFMCVIMYIFIYIFICTYTHTHTYSHTHTHTRTLAREHTHKCTHKHLHAHTHTHTHTLSLSLYFSLSPIEPLTIHAYAACTPPRGQPEAGSCSSAAVQRRCSSCRAWRRQQAEGVVVTWSSWSRMTAIMNSTLLVTKIVSARTSRIPYLL